MPDTVNITNLDSGETVSQSFNVSVNYTLDTVPAKIHLDCAGITPPSPHQVDVAGSGTVPFPVSHGSPSLNDTVTATAKNLAGTVTLATGTVVGVNFDDNPPIGFGDPPPPPSPVRAAAAAATAAAAAAAAGAPARAAAAVAAAAAAAGDLPVINADQHIVGYFNPQLGTKVMIVVLRPNPSGAPPSVVFISPANAALVPDGTGGVIGRWSLTPISNLEPHWNVNGWLMRLLLTTENGVVKAIVSARLKESLPGM